jgi:hypothetical protein
MQIPGPNKTLRNFTGLTEVTKRVRPSTRQAKQFHISFLARIFRPTLTLLQPFEGKKVGQINIGFVKVILILWLSSLVLAPAKAGEGKAVVITAKPIGTTDQRNKYFETLLEKILNRKANTRESTRVVQAKVSFSEKRMLHELKAGANLQVVAEVSNPEWDEKLLPVRIPIRKGIHGYRLFLINRQDQPAYRKVTTLSDLKKFATGAGPKWSTLTVMEKAGFRVEAGDTYSTLFNMLKFRRFTSLGRGIDEAFREREKFSKLNSDLVVEESLGLYFPLPTYFYVSPKNPVLAAQIEAGLKAMKSDGSFDRHFFQYHQEDILNARLWERRIFRMPNPYLARKVPPDLVAFWSDLNEESDFGLR